MCTREFITRLMVSAALLIANAVVMAQPSTLAITGVDVVDVVLCDCR